MGNSVIIHVCKEKVQHLATSLISMLEPSVISRNPFISKKANSRNKVDQHSRSHFLKAETRDTGELNTLADKVTFSVSVCRCHKILARGS